MSRRRLGIVAAVVVVLAAAVFLFVRSRKKDLPSFESTEVERGSIVARITATGTLNALTTVQVGSQVSGRIAELKVDFNSPVKKGQLIAKIDPQLFNAALEQARANYQAAVANLQKSKVQAIDAQRQADRSQALREKNLIAQADLDTAQATADAAKAQVAASEGSVAQARANLTQAQVNLAYTDIYSPTDGVVISRSVDVGQTVAASLQAPTLFTIAGDLRKMQVHTSVAEADVGKLAEGMPATFRVDAYPTEEFQGVISQIRNAAQTVQNVVTYDAVIDVNNDELKLRPGMTANVTVIYARRDDVLRVPNAALRFRPPADVLAQLRQQRGGSGGPGMGPNGGGRWGGADGGQRRAGADGQWHQRHGGQGATGGVGAGGGAGDPTTSERGQVVQAAASGAPTGSPGPSTTPGAQPGATGAPGAGGFGQGNGQASPDQKTVWVLRGALPAPVRIRAGVTDGSFTEVADGALSEGDKVITDIADASGAPSGAAGSPGSPRGGFRGGRMF